MVTLMLGSSTKTMLLNQKNQDGSQALMEAQLIQAAQKGSVPAFNQLVRHYEGSVYHTAFRVLGNGDAAADATQDAFVSAFRHLNSFRGGSFRAWLMRIATNACYDQLRAKQRTPSTSLEGLTADGENLTSRSESPQEFAERRELDDLIQKGLAVMPAEHRMTLVLADIEEFSYEEIAQITQANIGTVKSRLARARAYLREFLLSQDGMVPKNYRYARGGDVAFAAA